VVLWQERDLAKNIGKAGIRRRRQPSWERARVLAAANAGDGVAIAGHGEVVTVEIRKSGLVPAQRCNLLSHWSGEGGEMHWSFKASWGMFKSQCGLQKRKAKERTTRVDTRMRGRIEFRSITGEGTEFIRAFIIVLREFLKRPTK